MKDEELFKAWKSEQYKDQSTEEKMEFVEHLHTFPKYFEKTFLAGLKAGRPQWHDLRKDKNDLPKEFDINKNRWEMENRITEHIVQNQYGERVCCLNEKWYYEEGGEAYVIAWCEIPTFDKE